MVLFKFKKKKRLTLYQDFKQQQNKIENPIIKTEELIIKGIEVPSQEDVVIQKDKIARKKKKIKVTLDATLVIAVCAFDSGVGCTHIAKSLAYFIKNNMKKTVCLIDMKGKSTISEINGIEVFKKDNLYDLYDQYKYIILDVGKYDIAAQREIKLSQIKIMCVLLDETYLRRLAEFIRCDEISKKWKYIFNHVPSNKQKKVDALMEDYEYWCMPVNDAKIFDKETSEIFNRLVQGGKI